MKRFLCGFVLLCLLVGGEEQAQADYVFTTLEGILAGGINDSGQIVGSYDFPLGGFLYSGGRYTSIKVPSFPLSNTIVSGINNAGQIVGYYNDANGVYGFLRSGGSYTRIDVPASLGHTYAYGINNAGQIVGYYQAGGRDGPFLGFLLSGGSYTTINVPGAPFTTVSGINDHSQIVGEYIDRLGDHGFLLSGGSTRPSTCLAP